jgi:hypothetical protein
VTLTAWFCQGAEESSERTPTGFRLCVGPLFWLAGVCVELSYTQGGRAGTDLRQQSSGTARTQGERKHSWCVSVSVCVCVCVCVCVDLFVHDCSLFLLAFPSYGTTSGCCVIVQTETGRRAGLHRQRTVLCWAHATEFGNERPSSVVNHPSLR